MFNQLLEYIKKRKQEYDTKHLMKKSNSGKIKYIQKYEVSSPEETLGPVIESIGDEDSRIAALKAYNDKYESYPFSTSDIIKSFSNKSRNKVISMLINSRCQLLERFEEQIIKPILETLKTEEERFYLLKELEKSSGYVTSETMFLVAKELREERSISYVFDKYFAAKELERKLNTSYLGATKLSRYQFFREEVLQLASTLNDDKKIDIINNPDKYGLNKTDTEKIFLMLQEEENIQKAIDSIDDLGLQTLLVLKLHNTTQKKKILEKYFFSKERILKLKTEKSYFDGKNNLANALSDEELISLLDEAKKRQDAHTIGNETVANITNFVSSHLKDKRSVKKYLTKVISEKLSSVYEAINKLPNLDMKLEGLSFLDDNEERINVISNNLSEAKAEQFEKIAKELHWFENSEESIRNSKIQKTILAFLNAKTTKQKKTVIEYINKHETAITEKQIEVLSEIIYCFDYSNSLEISNFQEQLLPLVLETPNPLKTFNQIEQVFLKNNIPMLGKTFLCFQYLYPKFSKKVGRDEIFDFSSSSISPELSSPTQTNNMKASLRNATETDIRFQIIFNDLIRIATRSNNRSLIEYIDNIEKGNSIFIGLSNGLIKYEELDDESKEIVSIFSEHLTALYERTQKGNEEILSSFTPEEKIAYFSTKFKPTKRYDLPDRIIRSFAYSAGFENFEQFKNTVINSVKEKEAISISRAEELSHGKKLILEPGDFIRGIGNINSFGSTLNNGNVCKEFLGTYIGKSDSDRTPLDIDWSLICLENASFDTNLSSSPTGNSNDYGNIYIVMKKDNPSINITRGLGKNGETISGTSQYDPSKIEMFTTLSSNHYGARTGIASTDIDYIIYKGDEKKNPDDSISYVDSYNSLSIMKNEIVKNGFYIPIVDYSGNLVFTVAEYKELKDKMMGLSHYGSKEYHLEEHRSSPYIEQIESLLHNSRQTTQIQSQMVYQAIANAISEIIIDKNTGKRMTAVNKISPNINAGSIEVLETGSSVRGTNVPFDYDFDYIFRLDADWDKDPEKSAYLREQICKKLNINPLPSGDFREVKATIPGMGEVMLDITFIKKNDKVDYSTEMSLKDRMDTISEIDPKMSEEVAANIILAKLLFKKNNCYKNKRRDENQGGMGGVGIENWIMQNGGTLESAAKSFLEASEGKDFDSFKKAYHVHDYGKNHLYQKHNTYPYDDFVYDNMNATGYKKMQEVLRRYLRYLNGEKEVLPEITIALEEIKSQQAKISEYLNNIMSYSQDISEEQSSHYSRGNIASIMVMCLSLIISIITIILTYLSK